MGDEAIRQAAWDTHCGAWMNCMRCKLADIRCSEKASEEKFPGLVPMGCSPAAFDDDLAPVPWHRDVVLMLSGPDPRQERYGNYSGNDPGEPLGSQNMKTLRRCLERLEGRTPYELEDMFVTSALGCRNVNFNDYRKMLKPTKTVLTPCTPRWQAELMFVDPVLVIAFGHAAYAACNPRQAKAMHYHAHMGESFRMGIYHPRVDVNYDVYVAPDPWDVYHDSRGDQWSAEFSFTRPELPAREPVDNLTWHLYRALWTADTIRRARAGEAPHAEWEEVLSATNKWHDEKTDVATVRQWALNMAADMHHVETGHKSQRGAELFSPDIMTTEEDEDE
jgi:uracil-DNA glycosylase